MEIEKDRQKEEWKNNVAVSPLPHRKVSKLGQILPTGLGGDSVTDRWTDEQTDGQFTISTLISFKKRGNNKMVKM